MTRYICDGSRRGKRVGAGIVRVENGKEEQMSFYTDELPEDYCHEVYTFQKVLEIAQERNDSVVVIENDSRQTLSALNKTSTLKPKAGINKQIYPLKELLRSSEGKGTRIIFQYIKKGKGAGYHRLCHQLSRLDWKRSDIPPMKTKEPIKKSG